MENVEMLLSNDLHKPTVARYLSQTWAVSGLSENMTDMPAVMKMELFLAIRCSQIRISTTLMFAAMRMACRWTQRACDGHGRLYVNAISHWDVVRLDGHIDSVYV
jgi:hypothetical protein